MKKLLLTVFFVIPLCLHVPYLINAWRYSRLDQFDGIFYLVGIISFIFSIKKEQAKKCDYWSLFLLFPMLFLSLTTPFHHINAVGIASSVILIFSGIWFLYSWNLAYLTIPNFMILLLGTPSSSYIISLLLMSPVWLTWTIKFAVALLALGWVYCNKKFNLELKKGAFFFSLAFIGSCFLLLHSKEIYFEGKSFIPIYSNRIGNFWGRSIKVDENTKRFFVTSLVNQYRYTQNNIDISVLAVKCGNNLHEIHPASHCYRTSSWTIHSEKILYLEEDFAVTEIDAQKGATRYLTWVWYSSEKFSTPSFIGFRRHFSSVGNYYTYQISIPIKKDINVSRKNLQEFISLLKKVNFTVNMENVK